PPRVRRRATVTDLLETPQEVVGPSSGKGGVQPGGVDEGAGALAPEQLPFEEVLLTPAACRDRFGRAASCALVRQQPFQDSDRGMEGRAHRTVLHFAVPTSIFELLTQ